MSAIFAARLVGDLFNASLFDAAMAMAGYPYLEAEPQRRFCACCAEDIMTTPCIAFAEVESAHRIAYVLRTASHAAFPVVERGSVLITPSPLNDHQVRTAHHVARRLPCRREGLNGAWEVPDGDGASLLPRGVAEEARLLAAAEQATISVPGRGAQATGSQTQ